MEQEKVVVKLSRHQWPDEIKAKKKQRWIIRFVLLSLILSFFGGWVLGTQASLPTTTIIDESKYGRLDAIVDTLSSVWYYGKNVEGDVESWLINNAILGMIELNDDPFTSYMTPQEVIDFNQSIDMGFVGIGVQFYVIDGVNIVERVFRNSPAEAYGVLPGDIIYKVDGVVVEGMPTSEIASRVMGEAGTVVSIEFIRGNLPIVKDIVRGRVSNSAFGQVVNNEVGVLEISQFGSNTANEVKVYLDDMKAANISKLVIDLRDNGGGFLDTLLQIAAFFLPKDTTVIIQQYKDDNQDIGKVATNNQYTNFTDIVILVNGNTASASEVLAAALSEQANIKIVGVTTFGKGTVQVTRPFSDGSALKVTTAQWLTPQGNTIHQVGITPDIEVKLHPVFYQGRVLMGEDEVIGVDQVSPYVEYMQLALDFIGYPVDRLDGYFSLSTLTPYQQFRSDYNLNESATLDATTYQLLYTEVLRKWHANRSAVDTQLQVAIAQLYE